MYIKDGIVYAGDLPVGPKIIEIKPLPDYFLKAKFSNGTEKICDFKPLLDRPAFLPLKDKAVFESVGIERGVPVWCGGSIDISPGWIDKHGAPV